MTASDRQWIILRGGLFYGPGTDREDDWFARAALGTLKIPGDGTDFASLIHVADMADATAVAVERAAPPSTFPLSGGMASITEAALNHFRFLIDRANATAAPGAHGYSWISMTTSSPARTA